MSPGGTLLLLAGVHLTAVMSPGPNTVLVIHTAAHSRRLGLITALGFWPAGAFWSAVGLAGLGSVLALAPWFGLVLRVVCGCYLLWLGAKAIARSFGSGDRTAVEGAHSWRRAVAAGFFTNLSNPKAVAYYMSVFAATGAIALPMVDRAVAIVLLPTVGVAFYCALALLMSSRAMQTVYRSVAQWLDRVAGAAMLLFRVKLLSAR